MMNPFHSPGRTRRLSLTAVAKAAEQTNEKTAQGARLFSYPIGIAEDVISCLETAGEEGEPRWMVEVKTVTDTEVTVLLRDPTCRFVKQRET